MLHTIRKSRGGFTLVEIMIVVAIIALLAAIAVPGFLRSRKRSQATAILNDARIISGAIDQYAIESNHDRQRHRAGGLAQGLLQAGQPLCTARPRRAPSCTTSWATAT